MRLLPLVSKFIFTSLHTDTFESVSESFSIPDGAWEKYLQAVRGPPRQSGPYFDISSTEFSKMKPLTFVIGGKVNLSS